MNDTGEPNHVTADAPIMVRLVERLESTAALDRFSPVLSPVADILLASAGRRDLLLGTSVGHAVHPFLTDLPIGAWTCTTLLNLVGGERSGRAAKHCSASVSSPPYRPRSRGWPNGEPPGARTGG